MENTHNGHRERLTELISNAGIENVSEIQSTEFFLTYIFPRGDVNPLAHKLLNKFECFGNILDANENELMKIDGINARSARKIKMFSEIFNLYSSSKMNKNINLKNKGEFLDILEQLLRFKSTENLFLFAIDSNFGLLQKRCYDLKQVREVGIPPLELYNFILSTKLSYLIVAHNHPNGKANASDEDHSAYEYIEKLIQHLDCKILDSFVVGTDGIYSETQSGYIRHFDTSEKFIKICGNK